MDIEKTGAFIAALRKEHGLTQKQLADQIHITDKAISRWETGKGLPDASSLLSLSELFDVSVNELLHGERIAVPQTTQVAEDTIVGVLQLKDRERQKKRRLIAVLITLLAVIGGLLLSIPAVGAFNDWRGEGLSISSAYSSLVANNAVSHIAAGNYESAASSIGFVDQHRPTAETAWIEAMNSCFSEALTICSFEATVMTEDDQFISGKAFLTVYDQQSDITVSFTLNTAYQNGIVFGGLKNHSYGDERVDEIAALIDTALCTRSAG